MKHLMIVAALFLAGACLDDPADYSFTEQAAMDGPRVGISRERHCQLLSEAWQELETQKRSFNGCYKRYCAEWVAMLTAEQRKLEDDFRWSGCYGTISGNPQ